MSQPLRPAPRHFGEVRKEQGRPTQGDLVEVLELPLAHHAHAVHPGTVQGAEVAEDPTFPDLDDLGVTLRHQGVEDLDRVRRVAAEPLLRAQLHDVVTGRLHPGQGRHPSPAPSNPRFNAPRRTRPGGARRWPRPTRTRRVCARSLGAHGVRRATAREEGTGTLSGAPRGSGWPPR